MTAPMDMNVRGDHANVRFDESSDVGLVRC